MSIEVKSTTPAFQLPAKPKHPLRFSINGVMDTIPNLKKFIEDQDFDAGLKLYVCTELDRMESNAAEIHLHEVGRVNGGLNLHLTLAAVHLGARKGSVSSPKVDLPATTK